MTETPTGLTNTIKPGQFKFGSVGKPFPGVEVKLDLSNSPAEGQGEVGVAALKYHENSTKIILMAE